MTFIPSFDKAAKLVIEFRKDPPVVVYPPKMWRPKRLVPALPLPVAPVSIRRFLRSDS